MKEHVYPLKTELEEKTVKIQKLNERQEELKIELDNLDTHYTGVCKAILQTQGIMIVDLDSHNIFASYQNQMKKEKQKLIDRKNKKQNEQIEHVITDKKPDSLQKFTISPKM